MSPGSTSITRGFRPSWRIEVRDRVRTLVDDEAHLRRGRARGDELVHLVAVEVMDAREDRREPGDAARLIRAVAHEEMHDVVRGDALAPALQPGVHLRRVARPDVIGDGADY
jgi:hypothetical protein